MDHVAVLVTGSNIDISGVEDPSPAEVVEVLEDARLAITAMLNQINQGVGIVGSEIEIKKDV